MILQEPLFMQPSCCAAPRERSSCRPLTNGPLSLIRTIAVLLPCVKCNLVPKGKVLCAAVIPSGLNRSPFAVRLPCIYQEAFIVPVAASLEVVAQPARTGTTRQTDKTRNTSFPFVIGGASQNQTGFSWLCRPATYRPPQAPNSLLHTLAN